MKNLFLGIAFIVLIGFGGFFYRNITERLDQKIACPVDTFVCPDGTELTHAELSCEFPACPPPNVTIDSLGITFALPVYYSENSKNRPNKFTFIPDYTHPGVENSEIIEIQQYTLATSTVPTALIQDTAINETSGLPVGPNQFTSVVLGGRTFTVVPVDRFEGGIKVSYYLVRPNNVLRFDATDKDVVEWMEPELDLSTLPAQKALRSMLGNLQFRTPQ